MIVILLLLALQNNVDAGGCSSEPGYFEAGDSIEGFAAISKRDPDDCAIQCARVKGCVAWTFSSSEELRNLCWLVKTDENKSPGVNFDWVRGPPCNKEPREIDPSTLEPTTVDSEDESSTDTRTHGPEEPATEEPKPGPQPLSDPAVLALFGGLAIIVFSCLTAFFCWCGCCLQRSCSSNSGGEDPSTRAERELTAERWSPPLEYKQSRREESDKSVGSVFYEDADVYR